MSKNRNTASPKGLDVKGGLGKNPGSVPTNGNAHVSNSRNGVRALILGAVLAVAGGTYWATSPHPQSSKSNASNSLVDGSSRNYSGSRTATDSREVPLEESDAMTKWQLFLINKIAWEMRNIGRDVNEAKIAASLKRYAKTIDSLPKGSEIKHLTQVLFDDINTDFAGGGLVNVQLDSAFHSLTTEYTAKTARFARVQPSETPLANLAAKLEELGVDVDYVVMSDKADAPTVVLFPQMHENSMAPELDESLSESGVDRRKMRADSARTTWTRVEAIVEAFPKTTIHLEGDNHDTVLDLNKLDMKALRENAAGFVERQSALDIAEKFRHKVVIRGTEDEYLKSLIAAEMDLAQKALTTSTNLNEAMRRLVGALKTRFMVANIFNTYSIASAQNKDSMGIATVGSMHECVDERLSYSALLALRGVNVVVVNSPYALTPEEVRKFKDTIDMAESSDR